MAMQLLDKICRGVRSASIDSVAGIPVACMNLVASVSDFVGYKQQVDGQSEYRCLCARQRQIAALIITYNNSPSGD